MICINCHEPIDPNEDRLCEKCLEDILAEHTTVEFVFPFDDEDSMLAMYDDLLDSYSGEYDKDDEDEFFSEDFEDTL